MSNFEQEAMSKTISMLQSQLIIAEGHNRELKVMCRVNAVIAIIFVVAFISLAVYIFEIM